MYKMNSNNSNDALYAAVEEGSLEKLNEAAASGADVNFLSDKRLPGWKEEYMQKEPATLPCTWPAGLA